MTAFARVFGQHDWGQATWEIRSVNHRYLDLSFKLPESLREWEASWRNLAHTFLQRGKVECYLTFIPSEKIATSYKINKNLVVQLINNCQVLMQYPGISSKLQAMDLLRWPEVLIADTPDLSPVQESLTLLLQKALEELVETRCREGQQLVGILHKKLEQISKEVETIKERLPLCLQAQRQKIKQKFEELNLSCASERLEQELVLYAQRVDVEEEVERLATHVKEVIRVLNSKGAAGRRLDFLMQELGREANTLAAKAPDIKVSQAAIELKVLIEQMREQVQNVE